MATQIGAQMFTLREHCKTPADIAKSCEKLKKIGFGAVQASALGPIEPAELKKILDDNGLVCAATHRGLDQLKNIDEAVEEHQTLGCELTAIGGFGWGGVERGEWRKFAAEYSDLGKKLAAKGLRLGYHNHSHEYAPLASDPTEYDPNDTAMQFLFENLDESVWFELDTYWVQHGGADPAAWIEKCKGRIPAVHVKDMTITGDRQHKMCEVGAGNLNWPGILDACKTAGVQWYLIERDNGDLDPFESLKISYNNLREWGLS